MKKNALLFAIITLFSFILISCEKEEAPEADFSATEGYSSNTSISINFTDNSSNEPSEWYWTFEGGTPSTSTVKNPTVTYTSPGTFNVTLEVKNGAGSNQTTMIDYINVVKFNNPTHTDIDITINSKLKTIPVDDYVLFTSINNTTVNLEAETSGSTTTGDMVGLEIYWEGSANLNEYNTWNLNVNSDFVFLYITNSGTDHLTPLYVNFNNAEYQTEDYIVIANNYYPTATGYYYAIGNMEVRAYFESNPLQWAYWVEGTHFTLTWEDNQYKNLGNSYKFEKNIKLDNQKTKNKEFGNLYQSGAK